MVLLTIPCISRLIHGDLVGGMVGSHPPPRILQRNIINSSGTGSWRPSVQAWLVKLHQIHNMKLVKVQSSSQPGQARWSSFNMSSRVTRIWQSTLWLLVCVIVKLHVSDKETHNTPTDVTHHISHCHDIQGGDTIA